MKLFMFLSAHNGFEFELYPRCTSTDIGKVQWMDFLVSNTIMQLLLLLRLRRRRNENDKKTHDSENGNKSEEKEKQSNANIVFLSYVFGSGKR